MYLGHVPSQGRYHWHWIILQSCFSKFDPPPIKNEQSSGRFIYPPRKITPFSLLKLGIHSPTATLFYHLLDVISQPFARLPKTSRPSFQFIVQPNQPKHPKNASQFYNSYSRSNHCFLQSTIQKIQSSQIQFVQHHVIHIIYIYIYIMAIPKYNTLLTIQ